MLPKSVRAAAACAALLLSPSLTGCAGAQSGQPARAVDAQGPSLPLPAGVKAGAWVDLFAGGPSRHWRGYKQDTLPSAWAYDAASNTITRTRFGGDIITRQQYADFEFEIEWKVIPGGNSGIFYHATEGTAVIYENAPEMQVLDNQRHNDGKNTLTSAGANYGLNAPARDVTRPVGEWNRARVVVIGSHVEHWLNGEKLLEYELWTPEWTEKVSKTKFAQWPTYGLARRGHIGLQEHGDLIHFRHARVRELSR